jgi:hypothetical protein
MPTLLDDEPTTMTGSYVEPESDIPQFPEKFLVNLCDSIQWSRRQIMPGIQKRLDIWRQIVGRHYGSGGAKERVIMPFLRMQTSILSRHLVSRSPRILVETRDPQLRAAARSFQEWFAQKSDQLDLETILHIWALDAIVYPIALLKVCSGLTQGYDGFPDMGFPYLDNIDPERAVWDMAAKKWNQLDYIGHRYTVAKDILTRPGSGYDQKRVKNLKGDPYLQMNELGYEKTETLAQDTPFNFNRLREYIDCFEIYLPKEGVILHLPVIGNVIDHRPIMSEPYVGMHGPDRMGPYHGLSYDRFPGALLASPPVHAIYDMHEAINRLARKSFRQADRQKTNLLVQSTMTQDADKVRKCSDGDVVPVSHPESFKETRLGGPDQQNFAVMLNWAQQISKFGGNFDVLGGLGTDAGTLGQEKMLNQNSATLIQFMQGEVYKRTAQVCRSMLWYEWNSRRTQETQTPIPGMPGRSITSELGPEQRDIDGFFRLQFSVHPFSMGPISPQMRIQQWMNIFQGVILPGMQALQAQGASFDIIAFARKIADYQGLVDLDEVLKVNPVDPMQQPQANTQSAGARVRPPGTGEYTRRSVSENPEEAQMQEVMAMMKQGGQNGQRQ